MKYRDFGKTGFKVSALGFGAMRLPTKDKKPMGEKIDAKAAARMVLKAIDGGVNYYDTAYMYHGGKSESFLGRVLQGGLRDEVKIATKCPVYMVKKPTDFDKLLSTQLKRLRTDHVDFYLFHGLCGKTWKEIVLRHRLLKRAEAALKDGRIGHIGFSFHDDLKAFKTIVDGYDGWEFCQIQYNYMDVKNQAGTEGLRYAASKGLGVVIMEPLLGGRLSNPPEGLRRQLKANGKRLEPSDLALQWVWDQPEVSTILSGMTEMKHVTGNLESAGRSGAGTLTKAKRQAVEKARVWYNERTLVPCTGCSYCMPCPHKVNIPSNFEEYNLGYMHDDLKGARMIYARFFNTKSKASACKKCGKCEPKCPQKIPIRERLEEVDTVLGKGRPYPKRKA